MFVMDCNWMAELKAAQLRATGLRSDLWILERHIEFLKSRVRSDLLKMWQRKARWCLVT